MMKLGKYFLWEKVILVKGKEAGFTFEEMDEIWCNSETEGIKLGIYCLQNLKLDKNKILEILKTIDRYDAKYLLKFLLEFPEYKSLEELTEFKSSQLNQIYKGLKENLDTSKFYNPMLSYKCMKYIRKGIKDNLDLSLIEYLCEEKRIMNKEIYKCIKNNKDEISKLNLDKFSGIQIEVILHAINDRCDISKIYDPDIDSCKMEKIVKCLKKGLDLSNIDIKNASSEFLYVLYKTEDSKLLKGCSNVCDVNTLEYIMKLRKNNIEPPAEILNLENDRARTIAIAHLFYSGKNLLEDELYEKYKDDLLILSFIRDYFDNDKDIVSYDIKSTKELELYSICKIANLNDIITKRIFEEYRSGNIRKVNKILKANRINNVITGI